MELHRQTTPRKLSWVNRLLLSFLLRQFRAAQMKKDIAAHRLTKYADQLGQWDWAIRCVESDSNAWWAKDHTGLTQPINHTINAAPVAPAAPFQNADGIVSFTSAMPDTSCSEHSNSKTINSPFQAGKE